ncbi:MAG: PH domain-containing protein [Planctomycetota bacterium]|jgi:membrane protein YdbS with pleckstrin-like domain
MYADEAATEGTALERGLWRVLVRWFRVPQEPPELPSLDTVDVFLPSTAYLHYLRWEVLLTTLLMALATAVIALGMFIAGETASGWVAIGAMLAILLIGALLALLARLRFRTMWYALGSRALRARYGLWTIHEVTITYENVQNINVNQGPLMRLLGIWKLDIQTAGGSRKAPPSSNPMLAGLLIALQIVGSLLPGGAAFAGVGGASRHSKQGAAPTGSILGLRDPLPVRNRIMEKVRQSRSAGLGDERFADERAAAHARRAVTGEHVRALRSICEKLATIPSRPAT